MKNLKSTTNTLNTFIILVIFFLTANTTTAQNVQDTDEGISIKSNSILDANGNPTIKHLSGIDFRNSNNGAMSRLLGTNGSLKFKSTNTTLSNIEFYNAEDDFLGAFHFRKFANSNYPYFGGMTDANGQYFFQHKTNHSTLFRFDEVTRMAIFQDGRVAIGNVKKGSPMIQKVGGATDHSADDVSADEYKLIVETGILTEKVKVAGLTTDDWADYVFDEDYEMLSIDKLENYIKENKHLPNVPSAKEVAEKGLDLAKTDATLLEKIEESYLYIIELNKKFDDLASENNSLKSELKALKTVQD